jgi:hypothetical protein
MTTPQSDDERSPQRRTLDDQIAAEPLVPVPKLPSDAASSAVEIYLGQRKRAESMATTPTTRGEALAMLTELCDLSPDVRLGQLFAHLGFLGEDQTGRSLWDIDDEQLLAVLYHHRAELAARSSASEERPTASEAAS